ncbi:MAG TPA: ABC transporter ATP-binding protein [Limnochorda sp.]
MNLAIDARHLSVRYGRVEALQDLTFQLGGGKIYGLLGPNGSGKTSLLSVLAGFRKPTAGELTVGGEAPFENAGLGRQICFIRDRVDVNDDETVGWAFWFAAQWRPNWDGAYAERLARAFNLPLDRKVKALSRGQRSALGIVLGLASRAPVTIFDEAHLGLDVPSRYSFYEALLEDYMAHPRTIILASHLIGEMEHLLEEVIILDQGRLLIHDEAENLRAAALTVSGPASLVDRWVAGHEVLAERSLGGRKSVTFFGGVGERERREAEQAGLELDRVTLQDLFVHLVRKRGSGS